jgi:hypothetical protein
VTADCKGKHDICKEVVCDGPLRPDQVFGLGCVDPDDEKSLPLGALVAPTESEDGGE